MKTIKTAFLALLSTLGLIASPPLFAETTEDSPSAFSFNGFGTLGATRSSSSEAGFVRELSQPHGSAGKWRTEPDSLFGLQANWQATSELAVIGQVISRYHVGSSYDPEVSWAFLRWEPNGNASFRMGRLGTDFYLFSDSRQVGYSYLTVRPSADFFGVLPFSHIDGADAQFTWPIGAAFLKARLHYGWLDEKLPLADRRWNLSGSRMVGGSLTFQQGAWTLRASSSSLRFEHNLPINELTDGLRGVSSMFPSAGAAADRLDIAGSTSRFHSLGGVYDEGPLQAQLMISRVTHSSASFQNWWAGYALVGYRIGQFTPFVGYSWIRSQAKTLNPGLPSGIDPGLDQLAIGTAQVLADSHSNQHTTTFGVRWDFATRLALKLQLDLIRGKPDSLFPYRDETAAWKGHTNVSTIVLDYVF